MLQHVQPGQKVTAADHWNPIVDQVNANTGDLARILGNTVADGGIQDLAARLAAAEQALTQQAATISTLQADLVDARSRLAVLEDTSFSIRTYRATNFPSTGQQFASSKFTLASISIPDPGYQYIVVAWAQAEIGGVSTGTRYDLVIRLDSETGADLGTPAWSGKDTLLITQVLPGISGPLTGAHTIHLVAYRVYGTASAQYEPFNALMFAQVIPQGA